MKKYLVVEDRQGGEFGMGRHYTAAEWLQQAVEWRGTDGWEDEDRTEFIKYWSKIINDGKEQELIDYIADVWDLEMEEVKKVVVCEHCGNECAEQELNDYSWHCPECHEKVAD